MCERCALEGYVVVCLPVYDGPVSMFLPCLIRVRWACFIESMFLPCLIRVGVYVGRSHRGLHREHATGGNYFFIIAD